MNPRRGFLALVGGSLLSGGILSRASVTAPALLLPPGFAPAAASPRPLLDAMEARGENQMVAFLNIGVRMPRPAFLDWLEEGIQRSLLFDGPDEVALDRKINAAIEKHGSIVGALRAGVMRDPL